MIRVVFDTSVLYSAILKPTGLPARVFDLVTRGLLIPCVSPAVLAEYREVLLERPALRPHAQRAMQVLDALRSVAIHVTPNAPLAISRHEEDNRFYECAAAAEADYIITGNLKHFPKPYKKAQIVNARQLLDLLGKVREKK
jgi:putative PIN family toxin of toxin-antitoxin system